MSPRIKELAEQAELLDQFLGPVVETRHMLKKERAIEKFAELIVQECASICITRNVSNLDIETIQDSGKFTVQDLATKSCGDNLAQIIKDHFGIE